MYLCAKRLYVSNYGGPTRFYEIEDGKIRAQGKHEDILTEVKSYRSLFLEQQKASKLN